MFPQYKIGVGRYITILVFVAILSISTNMLHSVLAETILATIQVGDEPSGIGVNSATNKVYVSNVLGKTVSVIDGSTNSVIDTISVGSGPFGVGVNPTTGMVYVSNFFDGTISAINGNDNSVNTISVGMKPEGVGVNPTTNMIYVANSASRSISVIDGSTNAIINTVNLDTTPRAVAVNSDTNKIYIAGTGTSTESDGTVHPSGWLWIIDGTNNTLVDTMKIGTSTTDVAVNSITNMVYVGANSNNVYVINGNDNSVVATLSVGNIPEGIGVNPTTDMIYVSNLSDNTISIIDGSTNSIVGTMTVGTRPEGVGVNPTTNMIYIVNRGDDTVTAMDGNPALSTTVALNVNSANLDGNLFDGMWVELWQNGAIIQEGSTPFSAQIDSGANYEVVMNNWQNNIFDHWEDGSTNSQRTINTTQDTTITAFFNTNSPPGAGDDTAKTTISKPVTISVLANDSDPDGDPLSVDAITIQPNHGTVTINQDNTITYKPNLAFIGSDSFDYEISDGNGGTDTAMVSIKVKVI